MILIAFASQGNAAYTGINVGDKWTYEMTGPPVTYTSYKVTSVTPTIVMADTYLNGEFAANMLATPFIIEDSLITTFTTQFGTEIATYGGRSLTICDAGSFIFDTDSGIILETLGIWKLSSWSIYGEEGEIPGYSWVLVLLSIIGTSIYLLKKRYNKK
ncbi:MAG: Loki-CTERM sorting domain-containing protein [Promethearchaeota archaeon]